MNRLRCRRRRAVPGCYGQLFRYVALLRSLCTFACGQFSGLRFNGNQHIGVNRRGHNIFWIKASGGQNLFNLRNGLLGSGGHDRAEIACRLTVDQVALLVSLECFDQRYITMDRVLEHVMATTDLTDFLALSKSGAVTGRGEECANTSAGGT